MKSKFLAILLLTVIGLMSTFSVSARDDSTPDTTRQMKEELRNELQDAIKTRAQERMEAKEEFKADMKENREEFKARMEQAREEFKTKLAEIRDKQKQLMVDRINSKLPQINKRRTDHFMNLLEKLQSILDRIEDKANDLAGSGKDISNTQTAIAAAQTAIDNAEVAVQTQADKEYVIELNDESTLRADVGKTVSQLQEDLRTTMKIVLDAKQAVHAAARTLADVINSTNETPTPTP